MSAQREQRHVVLTVSATVPVVVAQLVEGQVVARPATRARAGKAVGRPANSPAWSCPAGPDDPMTSTTGDL